MSSYIHFKGNLRDILFNLFEANQIDKKVLGKAPFTNMDADGAREILAALENVCTNEFSKCFVESDRVPPQLDGNGNVTLPESVLTAIKGYYDGEWHRLEHSEQNGGFGAPPSVAWAAMELIYGSSPLLGFYTLGGTIARVIDQVATPDQKKRFLPGLLEKRWGGTMVLTEPDAGSDVGSGRAKARLVKDDLWEIEGVKRFITNGDFNGTENIVHLVLARPEGAGPGTKGLSMFIVPKFHVNDDGSLGKRNGAFCTNLEKKMGLKGSATCEMTFGGKIPARGYLVGNVHDGIRQMFLVIEQARMAIGIKSMATLSTAYLNALAYTKDRVQGPNLAKAADKASPRVRIIEHPDVRRMLMVQKCHAEGMRALCMYTSNIKDRYEIAKAAGKPEAAELDETNDFFLPLVKGYCSDKAYDLLSVSLQVFGGSGYCQDYPIEQYIRDQKIDTLYEGTTHIQAQDLIFRKILRDGGKVLTRVMGSMQKTLELQEGGEALAAERQALTKALGDVQGIMVVLQSKMGESVYHVGLNANRVLSGLAETVIGWLLIRHAAIATTQLATAQGAEKDFYEGKVAAAKFYAQTVLPNLTLSRKLIENSTLDLMNVSENAF